MHFGGQSLSTHVPAHHPDWRQGSVIPIQLVNSAEGSLAFSSPLEPDRLVILISQDCDIVHASYEVEPHVEIYNVPRKLDRSLR